MKDHLVSKQNRPCVIVMTKEPRAGRVKTRLGRDIGMVAAAWWYRHNLTRLFRQLTDKRWTLVRGYAPQMARRKISHRHTQSWQGTGDLGQRMLRLLRKAPPRSVLIGSDIPDITPAHIARAIATLGSHDAVLGPSPDGGYWLIGFRHPQRVPEALLTGVRWSSEHALADTLARLPGRVALIDTLNDVDTVNDLR